MKPKKEKVCKECHESFMPTGNRQVRCPKCSPKLRAKARAAERAAGTRPQSAEAQALARVIRKGRPLDGARLRVCGGALSLLELIALFSPGPVLVKRAVIETDTVRWTIEPRTTEAA